MPLAVAGMDCITPGGNGAVGVIEIGIGPGVEHFGLSVAAPGAAPRCVGRRGRAVFCRGGIARRIARHRKAAVPGGAGDLAVDFVPADMSGWGGADLGFDRNAGEGRPDREQAVGPNFKTQAVAAHKNLAADLKRKHRIRRGLGKLRITARGRKPEPRAVTELAVLFRKLAMVVLLHFSRGIQVDPAVGAALQQQVGGGLQRQAGRRIRSRQRGGCGRPERVIVRQGQQTEGFHGPVRAAGGVVLLAHLLWQCGCSWCRPRQGEAAPRRPNKTV